MKYFTFGRNNGLRVSQLALGTGMFGTRWGHGSDPGTARVMFETFADAGGTFVDTSENYQFGESEEILGALLTDRRAQFILATKYSLGSTPTPPSTTTGNSRRALTTAVEASLRRLRTDYIDLLWVHYPDPGTPIEEIMRGLDDLARAGKILYAGLSNFPAWRAARGATLAEVRGWIPLAGIQFEYSLVERSGDRENLPMAEALGLGAALWSPLGGGLLTGKYRTSPEAGRLTGLRRLVHIEDNEHTTAILDALIEVAGAHDATPSQAALAWLLRRAQNSPTGVVPIIGPRTPEQLRDYLGALSVDLDVASCQHLDDVSRIDLGQPHEEIANALVRTLGNDAKEFRRHPIPTV